MHSVWKRIRSQCLSVTISSYTTNTDIPDACTVTVCVMKLHLLKNAIMTLEVRYL